MRVSLKFCVVVAVVSVCSGTGPLDQAQSGLAQHADGRSSLIEQECGQKFYRGEYSNPEREYQVQLPKDVTAIGLCSEKGFRIYLIHPESGGPYSEPGFDWSAIGVAGSGRGKPNGVAPE